MHMSMPWPYFDALGAMSSMHMPCLTHHLMHCASYANAHDLPSFVAYALAYPSFNALGLVAFVLALPSFHAYALT